MPPESENKWDSRHAPLAHDAVPMGAWVADSHASTPGLNSWKVNCYVNGWWVDGGRQPCLLEWGLQSTRGGWKGPVCWVGAGSISANAVHLVQMLVTHRHLLDMCLHIRSMLTYTHTHPLTDIVYTWLACSCSWRHVCTRMS